MTRIASMLERLHQGSHHVPGVPEHVDHVPGHQGRPHHPHARPGHSARQPRVLVGWQRRIAALFGQWI